MHLAQELLTKVQCSGGSRSFAKETSTLKMRSAVADYQKLIRPTERIIKADPLTTTQEVSQELSINHSVIIWHLKQIRNVQKFWKWVPHELTANLKRNHYFEVSSLILTANHFSSGLWCVMKSGFYTTGNDQLSGWTKKKLQSISKSQTWTKRMSW